MFVKYVNDILQYVPQFRSSGGLLGRVAVPKKFDNFSHTVDLVISRSTVRPVGHSVSIAVNFSVVAVIVDRYMGGEYHHVCFHGPVPNWRLGVVQYSFEYCIHSP